MIHDEICTYEVAKLAKEKGFLQHIGDEEAMVYYTVQGTTSVHRPQNHKLSEEKMNEIEEKYLKNSKEQ